MLQPDQLLLLHVIGRHGSLAAAARELGITPSAVTQQVGRIERRLGAPVVERSARGARLTEVGALLAEQGAVIARHAHLAHEQSDRLLGRDARRLRVGALASTIGPVVAEALAHVRWRREDAELTVVEIGSLDGAAAVRESELDVAVVADYGELPIAEGLERAHLVDDPILLVVPVGHALAEATGPVDLRDVGDSAWVSGAPGRPHRVQQDLLAARFGVVPHVPFQTESYEVALAMVAARVAVALVPRAAWTPRPGTISREISGNPTRELVALTRASSHGPLLTLMLDALRETATLATTDGWAH